MPKIVLGSVSYTAWLFMVNMMFLLVCCLDKKNENKEVAVNEFLPAATAVDAMQYSM